MGDYKKDNKFGGGSKRFKGRSFGGDRGGNRGFGSRPDMHKAVCSECGASCEVPFRPTGDKPIYCNDCFKNKGGSSREDRGGDRKDFAHKDLRPRFGDKRPQQGGGNSDSHKALFEQLNAKLDKIVTLLTPIVFEKKIQKEETPKIKAKTKVKKPTKKAEVKKVVSKKKKK